MKSTHQLSQEILTMLFSSFIGCLLIGYIVFQSQIFTPNLAPFQFVISGAMGSVFFTMLRFTSVRNALAAYFVICIFIKGIILTSFETSSLLLDVLNFAVICSAVYLYWRYSYKEEIDWTRPFQIAGFFAILSIVITVILMLNDKAGYMEFIGIISLNLSISFLVGLGLGIGIEAGKYFIDKLTITIEKETIVSDNKI